MSNLQAKLYQDLKQRQLNRSKHNTGISRLIEKSTNYSHSKLEKEFKNRLEKGLFRLPDIGKGEHLIIDVKEKDEKDKEKKDKKDKEEEIEEVEEEEEEEDEEDKEILEEQKKLMKVKINVKKLLRM